MFKLKYNYLRLLPLFNSGGLMVTLGHRYKKEKRLLLLHFLLLATREKSVWPIM